MTTAESYKILARFDDLISKLRCRPLTDEEDAELIDIEATLDSL
jgi:hypothetical protein